MQVQFHILLHYLLAETGVAMAAAETGWAPPFVVEYFAVELVLNAIKAIVFLAADDVMSHILSSEVLLRIKRVIRAIRILLFYLFCPLPALLQEIFVA
jgi:hypothetical protein